MELAIGCICCTVADDSCRPWKSCSTAPTHPTTSSSKPPASPAQAAGEGVQLAGHPHAGHGGRRRDSDRRRRRRSRTLRHPTKTRWQSSAQKMRRSITTIHWKSCSKISCNAPTSCCSPNPISSKAPDLDRIESELKERVRAACGSSGDQRGKADPNVLLGVKAGAEDDIEAAPVASRSRARPRPRRFRQLRVPCAGDA